jgi:hypothetical protein
LHGTSVAVRPRSCAAAMGSITTRF